MTATGIAGAGAERRPPADLGPRPAGPRPGTQPAPTSPSGTCDRPGLPRPRAAHWAPTWIPPTLQRLSARGGEVADLIWEAPADLAAGARAAVPGRHPAHYNAGNSRDRPSGSGSRAQALWSRAWAANHAALELVQARGPDHGSPPSSRSAGSIASFEHHCGPHGLPNPHIQQRRLRHLSDHRNRLKDRH